MTFLTLAKGMTHAENILKAAMADHHEPEQFIQNFKTLLPEGDADTFKLFEHFRNVSIRRDE